MNRLLPGLLALCWLTGQLHAQSDRVVQRIFLVGDAGYLGKGKQVTTDWLASHVDWNDTTNSIIFLGNNVAPQGMPDEGDKGYAAAKWVLDNEMGIVAGKKARAWFIPGNLDYRKGKPGALEQLKNQATYISKQNYPNIQMLPMNGCPGPVDVQIGERTVIVFMDSQWWLQQGERAGEESDCDFKTEEEITTALKDIISLYPDKLILLAMHHPFYTHGRHGGYFTWKQHIFPLTDLYPSLYLPLPVVGSLYPLGRGIFGNRQDTKHPEYKNLITRVEEIIRNHPNVVHAAAHDASMQLLRHDSVYYVVSGSMSSGSRVKKGANSLFAKGDYGFAALEITASGNVTVKFYTFGSKALQQPVYARSLYQLPPPLATFASESPKLPDSMTVVASGKFRSGGLVNALLGRNYRQEWKTPVQVPVLDLRTEAGGLTPLKRGGGHQTKSLRLQDANGRQWVLRIVEKSVTDAALPPDLRGTFVKDLVADGVSASYPYAALSVPAFATAAGVPHANPRFVYIPDDPVLGRFRTDFANSFALLEERVPGNAKKSYSTDELAEKLQEDNDNSVNQQALLQARLLDMFMMDWDRHEDQWRWVPKDEGKGKSYYPVPRDRDQPFFVSSGLLPSIARKPWISPQVQGFREKAININTYNFNAKNIDRAFLSWLDEDTWKKATGAFLADMTDAVIEKALSLQPAPIQQLPRHREIIQKLKGRKKYFAAEMLKYYRFLSKIVSLTGSDKREVFDISREPNGFVTVKMFKLNKEGVTGKLIASRSFDPSVTREVRLYAMGGDDRFIIHSTNPRIVIRMIGGNGKDYFEKENSGSGRSVIAYDLEAEQNELKGDIRSRISADPAVNRYERLYYAYDLNVPFLSVNYNPDDGLFLGISLKMVRHGFRKRPFKTLHQFAVNHALSTGAYNFRWHSEFISIAGRKNDLLADVDIKAPDATSNFFGYGNGSVYDKNAPGGFRYYRARYQAADISLLLRHRFSRSVDLSAGPTLQAFSLDDDENANRFITNTGINGLDPSKLFRNKMYTGLLASFSLDNRNDKAIPTRGMNWQSSLRVLKKLNAQSTSVTQLRSDIAFYLSFSKRAGFVLATRFGAGRNFGDFEFFQAQYLGGTDNLRGYRKYRFAGHAMAYNNTEVRIRFADFKTYLFPGSVGILAFHDVGRIWSRNDPKPGWRNGAGGGIWVSLLRKVVITACYTASSENKLPLVTLGWQF